MTSSWKSLGRALTIVAIVLLSVAVGYLSLDDEPEDTKALLPARHAPDREKQTAETPPPPPTAIDAGTYRQSTESVAEETVADDDEGRCGLYYSAAS